MKAEPPTFGPAYTHKRQRWLPLFDGFKIIGIKQHCTFAA